ncbi:fam-a protein [Plasmodium vinckei petteri]|uniref:Fam-a protein n=1 Tax=Plasmodium vinckei petteri TaxID=138298 RepID=A0A6V7TET0_PLAVN|nr:fam-a protein [Plasmodium vinckei petteri]
MNKVYIKIALAILSVADYMQNIAFARNYISNINSSNEKGKHQLPSNPEEAKQAEEVMADVLDIAQQLAEHTDDYKLYYKIDEGAILYSKKVNNVKVGKLDLIIPNPDCYADVVNMIWDPNGAANFDDTFIKGSIPQIYNQNLLVIQQRYESIVGPWDRYYHALANKVELSEDKTAILLVSSDMNDHCGSSLKNYVNPIVQSANSFKPEIDSQKDIRNGKLYKMYINLVAFFIKKEFDCIKITYISSIDANPPWFVPRIAVRKMTSIKIINIVKLRDIFKKK